MLRQSTRGRRSRPLAEDAAQMRRRRRSSATKSPRPPTCAAARAGVRGWRPGSPIASGAASSTGLGWSFLARPAGPGVAWRVDTPEAVSRGRQRPGDSEHRTEKSGVPMKTTASKRRPFTAARSAASPPFIHLVSRLLGIHRRPARWLDLVACTLTSPEAVNSCRHANAMLVVNATAPRRGRVIFAQVAGQVGLAPRGRWWQSEATQDSAGSPCGSRVAPRLVASHTAQSSITPIAATGKPTPGIALHRLRSCRPMDPAAPPSVGSRPHRPPASLSRLSRPHPRRTAGAAHRLFPRTSLIQLHHSCGLIQLAAFERLEIVAMNRFPFRWSISCCTHGPPRGRPKSSCLFPAVAVDPARPLTSRTGRSTSGIDVGDRQTPSSVDAAR